MSRFNVDKITGALERHLVLQSLCLVILQFGTGTTLGSG